MTEIMEIKKAGYGKPAFLCNGGRLAVLFEELLDFLVFQLLGQVVSCLP
jgi:hypothetical protein